MASISLQQQKHFIVITALLDLASVGFANSNKAHTYHCGQCVELSMTKIILIIFLKRTGLVVFGKIGQLYLIVFSFSIGNFCYCGNFLGCLFCFRWV